MTTRDLFATLATLLRELIHGADPAIHQTLKGFADVQSGPPGDRLQSNKKTPFVWADQKF